MRNKSLKVSSEKPEMAETLPDIQILFRHYNALYFDDALGACIVTWAPRMRRSIGTCRYIEAGHCEIHMSKPLLKLRSSSDLKNSLLHEMVHAFLWIKRNNKSRRYHSSENLQKYQITCQQKKCNEGIIEKNKSSKRKREVSLIIPWLGVCTDEESEEDKEPLINKRSVKRMKLKESEERARQIALTHEIIYLD
ncbi:hypothetical protein MA16_Dca002996 [Dendrobium catenatum]|uniref:SprT-like domain-containing protein n=1 Tax=Dendrobium catenatum TaxID=906689 RepID=A0A2I0X993_9ASPA|nr:hypothetical protein MA16_Dca002996 [Dendrobium catenatum]